MLEGDTSPSLCSEVEAMKGVEKNGNLATRDGGSNKDGDLEKKRFDEGGGGVEKRDCTPRWKNDGFETLLC